jgi:hypothetical protein
MKTKRHPAGGTSSTIKTTDLKDSVVVYEISRYEIENCAVDRLVHDLRVDPANPLIHAGPGRVVFFCEGFDDDPREMFQIPEFQKFIRKADEAAPCWIYYALEESRWSHFVAFCTAENAQAVVRAGQSSCTLGLSREDTVRFLDGQLDDFGELCSLANVPDKDIGRHIKKILGSFGVKY